jgi:hypothetical protein
MNNHVLGCWDGEWPGLKRLSIGTDMGCL